MIFFSECKNRCGFNFLMCFFMIPNRYICKGVMGKKITNDARNFEEQNTLQDFKL